MPSANDIINVALRRVGHKRVDNYGTGTNKEHIMAQDLLDESRRSMLALHEWNFAVKRAQLSESSSNPSFGWDSAYEVPDDFLRMVSVHPTDDDHAAIPYRLAFLEVSGEPKRVIETNIDTTLYIRYIFDLQDYDIMPPTFRDALAWRLTREFATGFGKPNNLIVSADEAYRRELGRARAVEGVEDWPVPRQAGSWAQSRHAAFRPFTNDG